MIYSLYFLFLILLTHDRQDAPQNMPQNATGCRLTASQPSKALFLDFAYYADTGHPRGSTCLSIVKYCIKYSDKISENKCSYQKDDNCIYRYDIFFFLHFDFFHHKWWIHQLRRSPTIQLSTTTITKH